MLRTSCWCLILLFTVGSVRCFAAPSASKEESMDRDLLEVTIPQLQAMYRDHKYSVTEVVQWYLARIERYNGIYRPCKQWMRRAHWRRPRVKMRRQHRTGRCGVYPSLPRRTPR